MGIPCGKTYIKLPNDENEKILDTISEEGKGLKKIIFKIEEECDKLSKDISRRDDDLEKLKRENFDKKRILVENNITIQNQVNKIEDLKVPNIPRYPIKVVPKNKVKKEKIRKLQEELHSKNQSSKNLNKRIENLKEIVNKFKDENIDLKLCKKNYKEISFEYNTLKEKREKDNWEWNKIITEKNVKDQENYILQKEKEDLKSKITYLESEIDNYVKLLINVKKRNKKSFRDSI